MKRILLRAFAAIALCSPALPMSAQPSAAYKFPPADLMKIGVYYYPEAWPAAQWPRDMANIKKLGLEFVHMGEFAWAFMEPKPDTFDFAWLDRSEEHTSELQSRGLISYAVFC